ncbi:MAG TPA: protein translocase subunit SecF, partial [Ktedonobacterales bacterium]|nr:protein translocase subunit SecF [Ktedonobacterales bacterium]
DFTNGTTATLRFANAVSTTQIQSAFVKSGAQDVKVLTSTAVQSKTSKTPTVVYIQFSRPIGKTEEQAIINQLNDPKYKLPTATNDNHTLYVVNHPDTHTNATAQMIVNFASPVTSDEVKAALQTIPATDAPPDNTTAANNPTPVATTAAPTATVAPTAAPTATKSASSTPVATAVATATPVVTTQTFPVSVTDATVSQNSTIYQVETQTPLDAAQVDNIVFGLADKVGPASRLEISQVGPAIASQTTISAIIAVALAAIFILGYIAIAFHKVGSFRLSFRFGASAIIALLHDAIVVLGLWAIFGRLFDYKVDTLFLTAVLTVIGFSVHDTIVVFDRIRENLQRRTNESFTTVVDTSLIQTMSRSLNTSLTVLFTLAALTLFGGESIREFTLALLIGIASGTYSSIFNASMILVVWQTGEYKRWFRRGGRGKIATPSRSRDLATTRA